MKFCVLKIYVKEFQVSSTEAKQLDCMLKK